MWPIFGPAQGITGSAVEVEVQADDLRHTRDTVLGIIADGTRPAIDRIFADSLHDRRFTTEQAREYGFIDHIDTDLSQVVPGR
jgi:ATP-dependent Clp protease protease subunit